MSQADTNLAALRYAREAAWGTSVAGSTVAMRVFRMTSESLSHQKATRRSAELRSDRQRADQLEVGVQAGGDINFELIYGVETESFMEAVLGSAIASAVATASDLTFGPSTIRASSTASTLWSGFKVGQHIRVHGYATAAGVYRVAAIAGPLLTVTGSTVKSGASAVASAVVNGRMLRNGTTEYSYLLETDFTDITAVKWFTGMEIAGMTLSGAADEIFTGVFNFVGKTGYAASTSRASTVASAVNNTPMTATSNVNNIEEGGAAFEESIQSFSLQVANNLRARRAVGSKPAIGIGQGGIDVTGQITAYFETIDLYDKMIQHSSTSFRFRARDEDGNILVFSLPKVRLNAGDPVATGQDADVFLPLDYTAVRDPTLNTTIQIDFLPASV